MHSPMLLLGGNVFQLSGNWMYYKELHKFDKLFMMLSLTMGLADLQLT